MTARVCLIAILACACGKGDGSGGRYEIERKLETNSSTEGGLPTSGRDHAAATPALVIEGISGPIADGMREGLAAAKVAPSGNVKVVIIANPVSPKATGKLDITLDVTAVFAHGAEVTRATAKIHGSIKHKNTEPKRIGGELADVVEDYLVGLKLPADIGPLKAPPPPTSIAIGPPSCTLHEDTTVRCWDRGQAPLPIAKSAGTVAIDAGSNFGMCGLRDNGRVYCVDAWDNTVSLEARDVCGITTAKSLGVGQQTACAMLADNTVKCWPGKPEYFEPCGKAEAVAVAGVTKAGMIDIGPFQGCVATLDDEVQCWEHCGPGCKSGVVGQVDATPPTAKTVAKKIKATALNVGFDVCWGAGAKVSCVGRTDKKPRVVTLPEPIKQLAYATNKLCGLSASGSISCWPLDAKGTVTTTPLPAFANVVVFDAGLDALCAITATGDVSCTGGSAMGGKITDPPRSITF